MTASPEGVRLEPTGGRIEGPVRVIVQTGLGIDEQAVYAVREGGVEYVAVVDGEGQRLGVHVCFTPMNGYQRGSLHRVPAERVIAVVDGL